MSMKRICRILAAAALIIIIFCLAACKTDEASEQPPDQTPEQTQPAPEQPAYPDGYIFYNAQEGCSYGAPQRITYPSAVTGTMRHATVTLPADYDEAKRYPVLYLLHGLNCDDTSWTGSVYGFVLNAHIISANAHYFDGASEMILVSVNSLLNADESAPSWTSPDLTAVYDLTGREIAECLMPYVNEHYSVLPGRDGAAIAGFSMGGREAILTAFAYPDKFCAVGAFSSASFGDNVVSASSYVPDLTLTGEKFDYVQVTCGSLDTLLPVSENLKAKLEEAGLSVAYSTPLGIHSPSVWRQALNEFVKRIFTKYPKATPVEHF